MGELIGFILSWVLVVRSVMNYFLLIENDFYFINRGSLSLIHLGNTAVFVVSLIVAIGCAGMIFINVWGRKHV